ncbi:MAG: hypothetical protein ACO2Z9_04730 [Crocinitomicaceae bacterium]
MIATVGEGELYEHDLYLLMKNQGLNPDDTASRTDFILNWIDQQVYLAELKANYPDEYHTVELRSNQFAADLAKYELEEIILRQQLDTVVTEEQLLSYYNDHAEEFALPDYLVKGLYLKIPKEADFKTKKINRHYLLKNDKDIVQVDSYAKLYALNYYYNDSSWIYFSEFAKDLPVKKYNRDNIVLNRTKTYFSDDEYTYFLNILDFKLKDEAPPMEFLRSEIKDIIIAKRLQELKDKREIKILEKLKDNHEISLND